MTTETRKYEILQNDKMVYRGRTLYRIRALRDFADVKAGDLGGYIEHVWNLNHNGSCWLYGAKTMVLGTSTVQDHAVVWADDDDEVLIFDADVIHWGRVKNSVVANSAILGGTEVDDSYIKDSVLRGLCSFTDCVISGQKYFNTKMVNQEVK